MDQLQVAEKPVTTLLPTATTEVKPQVTQESYAVTVYTYFI